MGGFINLENVVAVITGGDGTIGSAVSELLCSRGATVVSWESRPLGEHSLACDVSDPASVTAAMDETVRSYGVPSILVNCAGVSGGRAPWAHNASEEEWDAVLSPLQAWDATFAVNVMGVVNCSREFALQAKLTGLSGAIVNVTSIAAEQLTDPSITAYSVSKAAVNALTRISALDFAALGIRVNAVAPGMMEHRMQVSAVEAPSDAKRQEASMADRVSATTPIEGRPARGLEVAQAILGLIDSDFVTGQIMVVDGGLTLRSFTMREN